MALIHNWNYFRGRYSTLEDAIQKPKKVKQLHLHHPKYDLNSYGKAFSGFVNLNTLCIYTDINYKYSLPKEISELTKLKKLYILNFPFSEIPDWLFKMKNLERLMIRGNAVTQIPDRICELKKLRYLRFENTDITTLPGCIKQLTQLKSILLAANFKLTTLDYNMLPPRLKYLSISTTGLPKALQDEINKALPHLNLEKRIY